MTPAQGKLGQYLSGSIDPEDSQRLVGPRGLRGKPRDWPWPGEGRNLPPGAREGSGQRHGATRGRERIVNQSRGQRRDTRGLGLSKALMGQQEHGLRSQGTETRPLYCRVTLAKSFIPLRGSGLPRPQTTRDVLCTHSMVHRKRGPMGAQGNVPYTKAKGACPSQSCLDLPGEPGRPCPPGLRPPLSERPGSPPAPIPLQL